MSTDPHMFDCVCPKGPDLNSAKVGSVAPVPPSVAEDQPCAVNKGSMSDHCRFARVSNVSASCRWH